MLVYIWYQHVLASSVTKGVENIIDTTTRLYEKYFPAVYRVAVLQYNCLKAHFCKASHGIMEDNFIFTGFDNKVKGWY